MGLVWVFIKKKKQNELLFIFVGFVVYITNKDAQCSYCRYHCPNVSFVFLSKGVTPNKGTISDSRKQNLFINP